MNETKSLVTQEQYLKAGIHIGTKFKTKFMEGFIYKTRPDGLSVLNLQMIDQRIDTAARFLAQFEPSEVVVASRRENGWKPARLFGKLTGAKVFAGRYPPGVMTNPDLENFIEPKVLLITDPWPDKNVIKDAIIAGIPIIGLGDTNNTPSNMDLVIPANNKGKKALALVFYILTREFLKHKGNLTDEEELSESVEDFTAE